jgi:hypothetical protein
MLAAAALVLSMLGQGDSGQVAVKLLRVGDWKAEVSTDRFTGEVSCALTAHRVSFHRDTLVFHLGRDVDTSEAFFRIDNGPVRSVREPRLLNETHGFFLDSGPIDNPSGGKVALPLSVVKEARQVYIRASPRHAPRMFDVSRFSDALAAAKGAGCKDESF